MCARTNSPLRSVDGLKLCGFSLNKCDYCEKKCLFGKKSLSVNTTTVFKCVVPVKSASIAEWRANDMAKIKAYTAEAIEFCANEFDKQVGEALSTANTYAASNAELGAKYTPK